MCLFQAWIFRFRSSLRDDEGDSSARWPPRVIGISLGRMIGRNLVVDASYHLTVILKWEGNVDWMNGGH